VILIPRVELDSLRSISSWQFLPGCRKLWQVSSSSCYSVAFGTKSRCSRWLCWWKPWSAAGKQPWLFQ